MEDMEQQEIASPSSTSSSAGGQASGMMTVRMKVVDDNLKDLETFSNCLNLKVINDTVNTRCILEFRERDLEKVVWSVKLTDAQQVYQCGSDVILFRVPQGSVMVTLDSHSDTGTLLHQVQSVFDPSSKKGNKKQSVFNLRTDEASASQYFQFYGFLSQQQNMMQDYVRTSTYQSAMLQNSIDFKDKVVVDVGAGSGILSVFAVQAGARKVYAIEASSMAVHCQKLIKSNKLASKIIVIAGKVEEIDLPETVDVVVSEPMGYMLFNERMLESYVHARKWLKPDGKMFPSQGILYCAPFTDELLYIELCNKISFWYQQHFHGMDLTSIRDAALDEYFNQPVVDTFDVRILLATPVGHTVDFRTTTESALHNITIPVAFKVWNSGNVHGLAFWFDVSFNGSSQTVWLSTAPFQPVTHWYQVRCVLKTPLFVSAGQELAGVINMKANERQSYDIEMEINVVGTSQVSKCHYDLKNPYFRYTGAAQPPAGSQHTNPTEAYWANIQATQGAVQALYSSQQQQNQQQTLLPSVINSSTASPSYMNSSYQPVSSGYQSNLMYGQSGGALFGSRQQQTNMWYHADHSLNGQYSSKVPLSNNSRQQNYSPNLSNHS
ncbi:PREDICTED: histone-arginine methyltransferase CARMER-like [Amphimedon queenslandica]|uniref:type I protein arginine methyltransferase n=2 Tax=Amphimedon queenslandica TaxID=400682 RepID=A0A1X7UG12_AMPQE|nr:PREDICTED: histone-arginine methyltransferase CARMER-like [Amphimedon queenslandica]|eukprot:XP_003388033.1 PREDICTED: histone-arginine methyltransferase CARMER-like [Amphimedon queenslandica]